MGPYRAFFYSNEGHEPAHIHVRREDREAKFEIMAMGIHWPDLDEDLIIAGMFKGDRSR